MKYQVRPAVRTVRQGTSALRKQSVDGIGFSVTECHEVGHVFVSAAPRDGDDLVEQAQDALRTVGDVIEEEGLRGSIVQQAVFLRDADQLDACRQIIREYYGDEAPATSYILQPPCDGKMLSIEAMGVGRYEGEVEIQRICEQLVITRHSGVDWAHVANVAPQTSAENVYDRSRDAFQRMDGLLTGQGFRYDHVIRTWLYLGDIVGPEGETQRYKELNRARTDFYEGIPFGAGRVWPSNNLPVFPASTGIGTAGRDVKMSCLALMTDRKDVAMVPLENPLQTPAFDYGACYSPKSPKFARAMAVVARNSGTVFVSGTASIVDSETQYVGDVEGQTRQTLDNIEALISADNFRRHGVPGLGASLRDLALVRVYIKRQEDYQKARAVCEERLGELPAVYAIADVCRPDLLVEIEGFAICTSNCD